jgi:hypothetical protein
MAMDGDSPVREPHVHAEYAGLSSNIIELDGRLTDLENKLSEVLMVEEEEDEVPSCYPTPEIPPLAQKLFNDRLRVGGMIERINSIIARLEV